ncbi:hypothetical protein [Intestinibacter sp.]
MKRLLILICLMLLSVGCSAKSETSKIKISDSPLVMEKYDQDNQISSFSVKSMDGTLHEVANNVDSTDYNDFYYNYNYYCLNDGSFIYLDYNNNLQRVFKDNTKKTISNDIAMQEDNIYDEDLGYVVSSINNSFDDQIYNNTKKTYGVSLDCSTIGYIDSNLNLHIQHSSDENSDLELNSDVTNFTMNTSGEYIYYLKQGNQLYFYNNDNNKGKIANNVQYFFISPNGKYVTWVNTENKVYTRNISSQDNKEIFTPETSSDVLPFKIYDNGSILYLNHFFDGIGELSIYLNGKTQNIASDIAYFTEIGNKVYYINKNNALCEKNINDLNNKEKIISDSLSSYSVISLNNTVYILDDDDNLYKINKDSKLEKISDDISCSELDYYKYSNILYNDMVFTKNKNQNNIAGLYIYNGNDKIKIADNVRTFRSNSKYVVYMDNNYRIHLYDIKTKKDTIEVENSKQYSKIYFGNQVWCVVTLKSDIIQGNWESTDNNKIIINNKDVKSIKFNEDSTATFYFYDGSEYTDSYEQINDIAVSYYMRVSFQNLYHNDSNHNYDIYLNKNTELLQLSYDTYSYKYKNVSN